MILRIRVTADVLNDDLTPSDQDRKDATYLISQDLLEGAYSKSDLLDYALSTLKFKLLEVL